jgi:putative membrane protein
MFINYIPLMLINMVVGFILLATFVYSGLDGKNSKQWVSGFGMTVAIALTTGLHMIWHWTLPGSYNIAFGELSVLFGITFLGASLALALGWSLLTVTIYSFFAGIAAIVIGFRIVNLGMTNQPILSGTGFIMSGLAGVLAAPALYWKLNPHLRLIGAVVLIIVALIWAYTGYLAYWGHLADYSQWTPSSIQ